MAVSGFEGFEKRLELRFFNDNTTTSTTNKNPMGLRLIDFESLDQVLTQVQCTVVSAVANHSFDAYVLSESSLFVYPTKIIIKTCGTTQLLKSIRPFVHLARTLNLALRACRYSRGSFIFPNSQPFPHTSFEDEVVIVEDSLPKSLRHRKASVMTPSNNPSRAWHVFTASADVEPDEPLVVVEVCMTELDRVNALSFFKRKSDDNSDSAGKEMTRLSGIDAINENAFICDFAFDPCGYSMNGVDEDRYSTIHVTPEDGFSYASFECGLSLHDDDGGRGDIAEVLSRAIDVFRPSCVSIATTYGGEDHDREVTKRVERVLAKKLGLKCRSRLMDEFPGSGTVVFQSFTPRRR
ncbi:S-adenosylmethionine decarboxylase proenzyme 4 [Raphanus sativus]|uniref:S-adenosylmethionine decarboxylase proenzyme n=1 Tax=Raphanus sativus TaxID=3726 RepID=A0A6J0MP57_RAPSA|nr:S-adenosylmethionine decarboxylase proenzyme 4 [Raphanus sativus]KAJ4908174.1 S-adenosylmethionine decarboxylase proenzyme 4 [Raphanus sativus]